MRLTKVNALSDGPLKSSLLYPLLIHLRAEYGAGKKLLCNALHGNFGSGGAELLQTYLPPYPKLPPSCLTLTLP